jgi:hypothetical protein
MSFRVPVCCDVVRLAGRLLYCETSLLQMHSCRAIRLRVLDKVFFSLICLSSPFLSQYLQSTRDWWIDCCRVFFKVASKSIASGEVTNWLATHKCLPTVWITHAKVWSLGSAEPWVDYIFATIFGHCLDRPPARICVLLERRWSQCQTHRFEFLQMSGSNWRC